MPQEGVIREVMETWPLQLVLEGPQGTRAVALPENVTVRKADGAVGDVRLLRPGRRVRIGGSEVRLLD
jgi:hypothetical protein